MVLIFTLNNSNNKLNYNYLIKKILKFNVKIEFMVMAEL